MEKLFFPLIAVGIRAAVVFVQEGQRRIPIQYAKRMVGRKMTAGGSTYLPLRVNMAGVIPIIFAAAILAFPPTMAQYFPATRDFVNEYFQPDDWIYMLIQGFMIVVFTYFYTAVQFNPVDQADNLRKYGGYIPGIRPGPPTAQYLDRVLSRLTLPGSLFLALVAVASEPLHRVRRLLAGERRRPRRHVGADRGRRRARHDAADGVADDDALLRGLPQVAEGHVRILILGPQGSGKGTQAKRIAAGYDAPHVATGDILRAAVANGSELGHEVRPILERGDLVPDDLMVGLIRERLADEDAFVLDGFPRTVAQAEALDAMLEEIGKPLDAVILLRVSDEVATARLETRAREEGQGRRLAGGDPQPASPLPRAHRARGRPLPARGNRGHRGRGADDGRRLRRHPGRPRECGRQPMIIRKSEREIDKIAAAGALVAETIAYTGGLLRAGVTTEELDAAAGAFIREHDGTPTSEGYKGYPKAICISPNDVVVHGIPDGFEVGDGDLVTIDVGVTLDGYIADSAYTFGVGDHRGSRPAAPRRRAGSTRGGDRRGGRRNRVGDVSHAIQEVVGGRRLLSRPEPRRPRRRPVLPRGPAHPELRRAGPRPAPLRGHDDRDRAHDHVRLVRGVPDGGRLDDPHARRLDVRALRAHRRDHRRRAADPHPRVGVPARRRRVARQAADQSCWASSRAIRSL